MMTAMTDPNCGEPPTLDEWVAALGRERTEWLMAMGHLVVRGARAGAPSSSVPLADRPTLDDVAHEMRGYFERHCTENEDVVWRRMAERLAGLGWIDVKPAGIAPGLYMIEKDAELCIRRPRDWLWYRQQTGSAEVLDCPSEPYRARRIRLDE